MRYTELGIQTQRESPSNAHTDGFALLVRAGYVTRENQPTTLGQMALARLKEFKRDNSDGLFESLSLPVVRAGRETFFPISTGEVEILCCPACGYAGRRELVRFRKPPPITEAALPMEKVSTPDCHTIEALAEYLDIPREKTAKALMFTRASDGRFVFVVVRGDMQLSEAKLAGQVGSVRLATPAEITASGAVPGYASPIGLKDEFILVDDLISASANLAAGANEPGFHLKNTNYGRDYSAQIVADLVMANAGDGCPECGAGLELADGNLLGDDSGLRLETVLGALAEVHHDARGLTLPAPVAPFDVHLMQVPGREMDTRAAAREIYEDLQAQGLAVLFDDRDERAGVKFNDADLLGIPVRLTVGEKNLKSGMVELKARAGKDNQLVPVADLIPAIRKLLKTT